MQLTMHEASVAVFIRMLRNLQRILAKGAAHAGAESAALLAASLRPDMYPLALQVQVAVDTAIGCAAGLARLEAPRREEPAGSFAGLAERIDGAIAWLEALDPSLLEGAEERPIVRHARGEALESPGAAYLLHHALPKFYFHVAIAYAILRHAGADLRKGDFMGKI